MWWKSIDADSKQGNPNFGPILLFAEAAKCCQTFLCPRTLDIALLVLLHNNISFSVSRLQATSRINTGTFTRPKKNKEKPYPEENNIDDMKENVEQPKQYPKVEDIENLAKLQEESKSVMKQLVLKIITKRAATWQNQQCAVRPAKTQIVWSESTLSAWRKPESLAAHWVHSEDSDQTMRMPTLI